MYTRSSIARLVFRAQREKHLALIAWEHLINQKYEAQFLICWFLFSVLLSILQYLTKQNTALREVNDTRLKIYENIEISIQDLEKQNHRLNVDNANAKKLNKK